MPAPPTSLFFGITGASGAPYALRLLEVLAAQGSRLQVSISDAGLQVVRHELALQAVDRDAVTAELLARAGAQQAATVLAPDDLAAVVSSGSGFTDAAVVCPCSLSTAAHIALGTSRTLIHRAGEVALKEGRRLVLVPREMPLSRIHLRRLLEASEAGAVIVPAAPAFYGRPQTVADLVDHVVGKVLTALGFEQRLFPPWGGMPA
jgi:4-hydroxy-3-polyprenylbenzoate decarboxylase